MDDEMTQKKAKYLTKSRFKVALHCPTKLRYELDSKQYFNGDERNPFLAALAEGGIQVGELAKLHYQDGVECRESTYEASLSETTRLLEAGHRVFFEAALRDGFKFVRVDVLEITDHEIRIIEVKSKSLEGDDGRQFFNTRGVDGAWRPYIEDVAFQVHVAKQYFRRLGYKQEVKGYLFCPDKKKAATVDGLHEHFLIRRKANGGAACVVSEETTLTTLGSSVMTLVDASEAVQNLHEDTTEYARDGWDSVTFMGAIDWLEELLILQSKGMSLPQMPVGKHCSKCSFATKGERPVQGKVSGRRVCFENTLGWGQSEFDRPKVWDVWNFRSKLPYEEGRWFMDELTSEDFKSELALPEAFDFDGVKMPSAQRQWIQIASAKGDFKGVYLDRPHLKKEIESYTWPLHFIDFETTAPAIPFFKGYRPYQGVSFQFSHHIMHQDGRIEHAGEYLGEGQGIDPTFEFVVRLHEELSKDEGTVFMFSFHENTYLNYAIRLLAKSSPYDQSRTNELIEFLQSICKPTEGSPIQWTPGPRLLVDMAVTIRNFFWHPLMQGSNSIKLVLPAVLNASDYLKEKYEQPIYGTATLSSLNFSNHAWVAFDSDTGLVIDPYKRLPKFGEEQLGVDLQDVDRIYGDDGIGNGGAAMTAWSYMQFAEMTDVERQMLMEALKKYCELDTMAMVLIMEYFLHETS